MAKGQATFAKRQKEIARLKHRDDKAARKAERKANPGSSDLKDMMAYVDEFGRITNKTPEQQAQEKAAAERKAVEETRRLNELNSER
ncbi:MAG: hypothetical protein IPO90_16505 [Flavobacteriales bacterium]|nr:hypothetical protein [Flavobacteriales bacterium]MBL0045944.1 hypothetical protein [Flavobacteriales bacterium]